MLALLKKAAFALLSPIVFRLLFSRNIANGNTNLLFFPVFDDYDELLHHYCSVQYYVGDELNVVFLVTDELREKLNRSSALSPPDYIGDCLGHNRVRVLWETADNPWLLRMLLKYRPFNLMLWREQTRSVFTFLGLKSGLMRNVDRQTLWGCYSYPSFKYSLTSVKQLEEQRVEAYSKFMAFLETLPDLRKAYVFGTGPSLAEASHLTFSDGYRIVCNTMIKNHALMEHLKPHFLVAADGIYHFGISRYACQFRKDLVEFLNRFTCLFLIPECYYRNFSFHYPELVKFTVPVPYTASKFNLQMKRNLAIRPVDNILNQLLLPLASSLADDIYLLGFDGRKVTDTRFWGSIDSINYEDLKPYHEQAHPGFFQKMDYEKYAQKQSDWAEAIMRLGEKSGKRYISLNQSSNRALQKRWVATNSES